MREPGLLAGLDDHGRELAAELVGVDLEPAVLGPLEGESEGVELLFDAEPNVTAAAYVDRRVKSRRVPGADAAVDAVGADDQVRIGELAVVRNIALEIQRGAQRGRALLQDTEQAHPANPAEPVPAAPQHFATEVHFDVVPVMEGLDDRAMSLRVRRPEVVQGLVGKHDTPAEGVVSPVALVYLDPCSRQRLAKQDRRVQSRRTGPQAYDTLHRADATHVSMDTPLYLTCQLNGRAQGRARAAGRDHSVSMWMRTLLTLESSSATVNFGVGSLALTSTSSPSSISTLYSADNPRFSASRTSWAT